MSKTKVLLFLVIGAIIFFGTNQAARAEGFDPNNIISDLEILDYSAMDLNDIQKKPSHFFLLI